jgi:hypothetical protein
MERFVHNANIEHYRRLLAESKRDLSRDEDRHKMLLTLLAEEEAKDKKPRNGSSLADALTGPPVMRNF